MLPIPVSKLREAYPDIELHLRETQTAVLLAELHDSKLDLILLALPADHPDLETVPLFEDRFVLALPPGHGAGKPSLRVPARLIEGLMMIFSSRFCQVRNSLCISERRGSALPACSAS